MKIIKKKATVLELRAPIKEEALLRAKIDNRDSEKWEVLREPIYINAFTEIYASLIHYEIQCSATLDGRQCKLDASHAPEGLLTEHTNDRGQRWWSRTNCDAVSYPGVAQPMP